MADQQVSGAREADALRLEGNEHFRQKRFNKAVHTYSRALELDVTAILIANRAQAYLKMGSYERAASDANEALRLDPKLAKALFRRAVALEHLKLYARAVDDLERLLQLDPQNSEASKMLERLKGQRDVEVLELTSFTKSEPLQSTTPLRNVEIKKRLKADENEMRTMNLNQTRVDDEKLTEEIEVNGENVVIPEPPKSFMEFYGNSIELKEKPKVFGAYFLSIPTYDFNAIFGDLLEPETLASIVRALNVMDDVKPAALESLLALSKVNRFDLCVLMVADEIREDLLSFLRRFGVEKADEIQRVRSAFLISD
ncbi:RPAP3-C domain-containing protein [Aphelenchoides besseyi]|nr:RPAP3-C domain-containing protein [Aphelenchoides besseyi]